MMAQHLAVSGHWCPGNGTDHKPHVSYDLTVDHITARSSEGGYRVICRSENSRKGAAERRML